MRRRAWPWLLLLALCLACVRPPPTSDPDHVRPAGVPQSASVVARWTDDAGQLCTRYSDDTTHCTDPGSSPRPRTSGSSGGPVHVRGYYRRDGTYVRPHTRRRPRR